MGYGRMGMVYPSIVVLDKGLRLDLEYAETHKNLAVAYRIKGLTVLAEKCRETAMKFLP